MTHLSKIKIHNNFIKLINEKRILKKKSLILLINNENNYNNNIFKNGDKYSSIAIEPIRINFYLLML